MKKLQMAIILILFIFPLIAEAKSCDSSADTFIRSRAYFFAGNHISAITLLEDYKNNCPADNAIYCYMSYIDLKTGNKLLSTKDIRRYSDLCIESGLSLVPNYVAEEVIRYRPYKQNRKVPQIGITFTALTITALMLTGGIGLSFYYEKLNSGLLKSYVMPNDPILYLEYDRKRFYNAYNANTSMLTTFTVGISISLASGITGLLLISAGK